MRVHSRSECVWVPFGAAFALALTLASWTTTASPASVRTERVPEGGIQPQVMTDASGTVHLVFLGGDPKACDVYYAKRAATSGTWSSPVRVNREPGSALAVGTIRGAQLALGRMGRVHVVWNGSSKAKPKHDGGVPLLYARSKGSGDGFEPERNIMQRTQYLDGGGGVAADDVGNVHVIFHASLLGNTDGEGGRTVFIARSRDDGESFGPETAAAIPAAGACSCCGLKAIAGADQTLFIAYRTAEQKVNRDMVLLTSTDAGATFQSSPLGRWQGSTCPMSSTALLLEDRGLIAAWEIGPQVYFQRGASGKGAGGEAIAAPGVGRRKHPRVAVNRREEALLVWAEGTGWNKGGTVGWQLFGEGRRPQGEPGRKAGLPVWSFPAVFATASEDFVIVY